MKYLAEESKDQAFERLGYFKMMDEGNFSENDMKNYSINESDIINAINIVNDNKNSNRTKKGGLKNECNKQ